MEVFPVLVIAIILAVVLIKYLWLLLKELIWTPLRIRRHFREQGIVGPPTNWPFGNAREIVSLIKQAQSKPITLDHGNDGDIGGEIHRMVVSRVSPHIWEWCGRYGKRFVFWFGTKPRLMVTEPEVMREVLLNAKGFREGGVQSDVEAIDWTRIGWVERRGMDHVKAMVPQIVVSTSTILKGWESSIEKGETEIDVHKELHVLAADVISRVAFGSNYDEGKRVFELQEQQTKLVLEAFRSIYIPGFRFVPTRKNKQRWKIESEIRELLRELIKKKSETSIDNTYLLGLMLGANMKEEKVCRMGLEEIVDECKTFYFAGKDTTGNLMTWSIFLLAINKDWQRKAREEVMNVCGIHEPPTSNNLVQLKIVDMILKETLRLYPPAVFIMRMACKDVKLGSLSVPRGAQLYLPILGVHHDPDHWGVDVDEFDPTRFGNDSKPSNAFFPFGYGQRVCIGQNLALIEAKVVLSMILQRFTFGLSPTYVHAPKQGMTLQPQYGLQVIMRTNA